MIGATNSITFTNEDMEVQYQDHRRLLYITAQINAVSVRRALVDIGSSLNLIPLSTLLPAGILRQRINHMPTTISGFGNGSEETVGHVLLVLQVGPVKALTCFHVINASTSYHILLGRSWLYKHHVVPFEGNRGTRTQRNLKFSISTQD